MSAIDIFTLLCTHVFFWMSLGFIIARREWISPSRLQWFMKKVVINILFPILMLEKILQNLVLSDLKSLFLLSGGAIFMIFFSWGITGLWVKKVCSGDEMVRSVWFCNSFHNYGFIAYPLISHLLGDKALALIFLFTFTTEALIWSFGIVILTKKQSGTKWKEILNVPFLTIIMAVSIALSGGAKPLPPVFFQGLHYPGLLAIPLALICVGGVFYFSMKEIRWNQLPLRALLFSLMSRTVVLPLLWIAISLYILPQSTAGLLLCIEAIMPASVGIVVIISIYGGDQKFAAIFSFLSNLVAIITIPIYLGIFWPLL